MISVKSFSNKGTKYLIDAYFLGLSFKERIRFLILFYPKYSPVRYSIFILNLMFQFFPPLFSRKYKKISEIILSNLNLDSSGKYLFLFHKLSTSGKIYIYKFDKNNQLEFFIKFNTNPKYHKKLEHEKNVLEKIKDKDVFFKIPEIIKFGFDKNFSFIIYRALEESCILFDKRKLYPAKIVDSIRSLNILECYDKVFDLKDLVEIKNTVSNKKLKKLLGEINFSLSVEAYSAHCDLGSENTFLKIDQKPKKYILVDWEDFCDVAPMGVDEVSLWLGKNHRHLKSFYKPKKRKKVEEFINYFSKNKIGLKNAIISLLFLAKRKNDLAEIIIK